jgi:citrate synthase
VATGSPPPRHAMTPSATYHAEVTEAAPSDRRPYSPGLAGIVAGETDIALVDGDRGRLLYRGYPIEQIVQHGTFGQVCELLWAGQWVAHAPQAAGPISEAVVTALRQLPRATSAMDALRTAVSVWGAEQRLAWPPTVEQARAITSFAPTALAAFARIREGLEPIPPDPSLTSLAAAFLYQLTGARPSAVDARALDAYFIVAAEHGFNASTFAALVIIATHSDLASAVCGAIGALKGPWHGGAPAEVVDQLHQMGSPDKAEAWIRDKLDHHERLMGFGHRIYRAYDPRAAALRHVAEQMGTNAAWLEMAVKVEDIALRLLKERHPERVLQTNVEFYTAAVLQGVGLPPDLFPATFALARHAGWTAHCIEYLKTDKLIRPDVRYIGLPERDLPAV